MDPADHQEIKKKTGECEALELNSGVKRKRKTSEAESVCTACFHPQICSGSFEIILCHLVISLNSDTLFPDKAIHEASGMLSRLIFENINKSKE